MWPHLLTLFFFFFFSVCSSSQSCLPYHLAPLQPTSITVAKSSGELNKWIVQWEDKSTCTADNYTVQVKHSNGTIIHNKPPTENKRITIDLQPCQTYTISVTSVNQFGRAPTSASNTHVNTGEGKLTSYHSNQCQTLHPNNTSTIKQLLIHSSTHNTPPTAPTTKHVPNSQSTKFAYPTISTKQNTPITSNATSHHSTSPHITSHHTTAHVSSHAQSSSQHARQLRRDRHTNAVKQQSGSRKHQ